MFLALQIYFLGRKRRCFKIIRSKNCEGVIDQLNTSIENEDFNDIEGLENAQELAQRIGNIFVKFPEDDALKSAIEQACASYNGETAEFDINADVGVNNVTDEVKEAFVPEITVDTEGQLTANVAALKTQSKRLNGMASPPHREMRMRKKSLNSLKRQKVPILPGAVNACSKKNNVAPAFALSLLVNNLHGIHSI